MTPSGSISGTQDSDDTKKKKEGEKQHKVPFLKLFSFADFYDYVLMTLGSLGACVHGASLPVFFIFFGKLINVIGMAYLFPKEASHKVAKVWITFILLLLLLKKKKNLVFRNYGLKGYFFFY